MPDEQTSLPKASSSPVVETASSPSTVVADSASNTAVPTSTADTSETKVPLPKFPLREEDGISELMEVLLELKLVACEFGDALLEIVDGPLKSLDTDEMSEYLAAKPEKLSANRSQREFDNIKRFTIKYGKTAKLVMSQLSKLFPLVTRDASSSSDIFDEEKLAATDGCEFLAGVWFGDEYGEHSGIDAFRQLTSDLQRKCQKLAEYTIFELYDLARE